MDRRRSLLAASMQSGGGNAVIIEFTIKGGPLEPTGTYQAEEGMTFGEWVDSEYNTDGYSVLNHPALGELIVSSRSSFIYFNGRRMTPNDVILQSGGYMLS